MVDKLIMSSVTEKEICDAVLSIRADVQNWYEWAKAKSEYKWLIPLDGSAPMMKKLQISMGSVFDSRHRQSRLKVAGVVLGMDIGSFKDLYPAEASPLIGAFDNPRFSLVLNAISMDPDGWQEKLKNINPLERPKVNIAEWIGEKDEGDDWW